MDVVLFEIIGKIKAINQHKKVEAGDKFKQASCEGPFSPYEVGTKYGEIILEECQISPDFWNEPRQDKVKLVFFDKKFQADNFLQKEFAVGQKYSFDCVGGSGGCFWPHFWKKEN